MYPVLYVEDTVPTFVLYLESLFDDWSSLKLASIILYVLDTNIREF